MTRPLVYGRHIKQASSWSDDHAKLVFPLLGPMTCAGGKSSLAAITRTQLVYK